MSVKEINVSRMRTKSFFVLLSQLEGNWHVKRTGDSIKLVRGE